MPSAGSLRPSTTSVAPAYRRSTQSSDFARNVRWEVTDFAGGYRLDFRPITPHEHAERKRERGEL